MELNRRVVLVALVLVVGVVTWITLSAVFATVFFALTVASVVTPVHRWLVGRGLPNYWAGVVTTVLTFIGGFAVFAPIFVIAYVRRDGLFALVRKIPAELAVEAFGVSYSLDVVEVQDAVIAYLSDLAVVVARSSPDLAFKATLFVMVLFSFLVAQDQVYRAGIAVVPPKYHDIAHALQERANDTLLAIYVLQLATALGTFLVAVPVFWLLGYEYWVSMAVIAGILQFVPIIGPSVLIGLTALWHLSLNEIPEAAIILVVGGIVIGYLPDAVIRPRLASVTADMPGSLYFVGFIGGLLSVGPIGVIAGPLVVALFSESMSLLADEVNGAEELGEDEFSVEETLEDVAEDAIEEVTGGDEGGDDSPDSDGLGDGSPDSTAGDD
ncbi:AI-2E family transporter [Haloarchaeobius amylolyticus]|uniref:AI-2E family transporter n=1 Tax=Haloarchaeobius amylolyticus TaxID=1198296 RepID=UPI00226FEAED